MDDAIIVGARRAGSATRQLHAARVIALGVMILAAGLAGPVRAQQPHVHGAAGEVSFPSSCAPEVQADLNQAVALLHSFWFTRTRDAFTAVAQRDPGCAVASWGLALGWAENMLAAPPTPERSQAAWAAVEQGRAAGAHTPRERDYIGAVEALFKDYQTVPWPARALAYERAMEQIHLTHPQDREAAIFYALALNITAPSADKSYAQQRKAAAILEQAFAEQPQHPGVAHYLIHSYDSPALAEQGLRFARVYTGLAPAVPHARHMPSHTFTRRGLWEESIRSNVASAEVATGIDWAHAQDYLAYAYLQRGQQTAAKRVVDEVAERPFAAPAVLALVFGHALPPVRYSYERGRWGEAAALTPDQPAGVPWDRFPQAEAVTHQARAIGAARAGDPAAARDSVARLEVLRDTLTERRDVYWAEQVDIWRAEAAAWIAHAEGRNADALQLMRWAAETEAKTDKHIVWPGPLAPAREMLGELLLALGEPAQALPEFEASLANEPDRLRGLYGAGRAAELTQDRARAAGHYRRLLEVAAPAEGDWAELAHARAALDAGTVPAWLPLAAAPVIALVAAGLLLVAFGRRRRARPALDHQPSRDT